MKKVLLQKLEETTSRKEELRAKILAKKEEIKQVEQTKYDLEIEVMEFEKSLLETSTKEDEYRTSIKICEELSELVREEE